MCRSDLTSGDRGRTPKGAYGQALAMISHHHLAARMWARRMGVIGDEQLDLLLRVYWTSPLYEAECQGSWGCLGAGVRIGRSFLSVGSSPQNLVSGRLGGAAPSSLMQGRRGPGGQNPSLKRHGWPWGAPVPSIPLHLRTARPPVKVSS